MARWARGVLCILIGATFLSTFLVTHTHGLDWDPCAEPVQVKKGDNFTIGLMFLPGANASYINEVLGNSTGGFCAPEIQANLTADFRAKVAVFNPVLDRLTALSIPYPDIIFNMVNTTTMVVVAFRGNISSPAAYIVSGTELTRGAGFVVSLALLVRMTTGNLQHLQWYDQSCNECGGRRSGVCVKTPAALSSPDIYACASRIDDCLCPTDTTEPCSFADDRFKNCSTAINLAWEGDDAKSSAFRTGSQLKRINAFSLTSLFITTRDKLTNFYYSNVATTWGDLNDQANAQYVSFESGLGTSGRRRLSANNNTNS